MTQSTWQCQRTQRNNGWFQAKSTRLTCKYSPAHSLVFPVFQKHSVIFHFFHEHTRVCEDSERYATYCVGLSRCCMPNEFAFLAWGCRVCGGLFDCSAPPLVNSVTSISPSNEVKLAVYSGSSGSTNNPPFIPLFFLSRNSLDSDLVAIFFLFNYIPHHYVITLCYLLHFAASAHCTIPTSAAQEPLNSSKFGYLGEETSLFLVLFHKYTTLLQAARPLDGSCCM